MSDDGTTDADGGLVIAKLEDQEVEAILESIPEERLASFLEQKLSAHPTLIAQVSSWQAPLPPADMLRQYNEIADGFADRIMQSMEREQAHRHDCEKSALGASIQSSQRGQWMGFGVAVTMIVATSVLIFTGHALASTIFGGVTLLGLVSLFTTGNLLPFRKKDNDGESEEEEAEREHSA